jgi:hypothetical protein
VTESTFSLGALALDEELEDAELLADAGSGVPLIVTL